MIRRHRNGHAGFTLLELLVSIAVMGVVTSLGVRAFFGLTDAWRDTRRVAELEVTTQDAFDAMRDHFDAVISPSLTGVSLDARTRTVADPRFFQVVLGDDRLSLPVYTTDSQGVERPVRASFFADRDELGTALVLTEIPLDNPEAGEIRRPLLERGDVLRLRFEFADPESGTWVAEWSRPKLPGAVRVSMTVAWREAIPVPGPPRIQISRKAVFPIRVQ